MMTSFHKEPTNSKGFHLIICFPLMHQQLVTIRWSSIFNKAFIMLTILSVIRLKCHLRTFRLSFGKSPNLCSIAKYKILIIFGCTPKQLLSRKSMCQQSHFSSWLKISHQGRSFKQLRKAKLKKYLSTSTPTYPFSIKYSTLARATLNTIYGHLGSYFINSFTSSVLSANQERIFSPRQFFESIQQHNIK